MLRVGSKSGAGDRVLDATLVLSGARVSALGGAVIVVSMVLISAGCAAGSGGKAQATSTPTSTPTQKASPTATPSSSAQAGAPESLGFVEGAQLDPLAKIGWKISLGGDAWTTNPDAQSGEVSFVNADGTCRAYYYQEVFETAAVDDRAASDELLALVSGRTADEIATYAADMSYPLTHGLTPEVAGEAANRAVLTTGDQTVLHSARVFTKMDYATSQMSNAYARQVECNSGTDPLTQLGSLDEIAKIVAD